MKKTKIVKWLLPAYYTSYLINNDKTGLTNEELIEINEWLIDKGKCININDDVITWSSNDLNNLMGQVCEFDFKIPY